MLTHGTPRGPAFPRPVEIVFMKKQDDEFRFIDHHFRKIEDWERLILVRFPKLPEEANRAEAGVSERVVISGTRGEATLFWRNDQPDSAFSPSAEEPPAEDAFGENPFEEDEPASADGEELP